MTGNLLETRTRSSFVLKAGTYYIGDPCYVLGQKNHDDWITILEEFDYFNKPYTNKEGMTAIAFSTAYGDGTYEDDNGREYGVDAGMIGAVPIMMTEISEQEIKERALGHIVYFKYNFKCFEERGVLHFGSVEIDTN